jgi:hypothetical protein
MTSSGLNILRFQLSTVSLLFWQSPAPPKPFTRVDKAFWALLRKPILRRIGCPEGLGTAGRFRGGGSLCDHLGDGMLKSLDLRTDRTQSRVNKTFAGIAASVEFLVGI